MMVSNPSDAAFCRHERWRGRPPPALHLSHLADANLPGKACSSPVETGPITLSNMQELLADKEDA